MSETVKLVRIRVGALGGLLSERVNTGKGTTSEGLVAKRDLQRYYAVLEDEAEALLFTPDELLLIDGAIPAAIASPRVLWSDVERGMRRLGHPQPLLVERLRQLTPGACMALVDSIERRRLQPFGTVLGG